MMKLAVEIESVPLGINKPRQNTFTTACILYINVTQISLIDIAV